MWDIHQQNSQPNFGNFAMKSMPLLAKLQTFLSEPLELNLQRSIANPPEF
jgi:hypothetical protein